jgi:dTDP-4-dehydrorhamnose 3,5-epimerase
VKVDVDPTPLRGLVLVRHQSFDDERGSFVETYRRDAFIQAGLPVGFEQVNHSTSRKNVVRGLHMQWRPAMGKLIGILSGRAYLVAVDIRGGSATLGQWFCLELAGGDPTQVWAPAGFAMGFCALEDNTCLQYFCTCVYNPEGEGAIRWNDPDIGIDWPVTETVVSDKDSSAPSLSEWLGTEGAVSLAS